MSSSASRANVARAPEHHHHHHHRARQKKFTAQRSILKNSQDNTTPNEDQELLEAKKQIILRRRRMFSHYRQYEQWRRRQFSYDPSYYRAVPPPASMCGGAAGDYVNLHSSNPNAFRRRRQYRRQFSCAERSREDSRESRDSSHLTKAHSMATSDTLRTDSSTLNHTNATTDRHSHFHVFQEEHSTSISERITRSRINSAIFVSSEGRGFDSIEFLRRHGSQSVLCRKAKSAENITENGRKKSFADGRQWHTDDSGQDAQNDAIELQECSKSVENHPIAALKTNVEKLLAATSLVNHSATVTTSNKVVGSISLETPPSHIREQEQQKAASAAAAAAAAAASSAATAAATLISIPPPPILTAPPLGYANPSSFNSASHDSTDTVEELVSIPIDPPVAAAPLAAPVPLSITASTPAPAPTPTPIPIPIAPPPTTISSSARSRVLVRQRSSTVSPVLSSAHSSPKALKLKCITPKLNNLPMVSVSGPSPPDEKPPPSDCL